jgi:hypothetical protein
MTTPPAPTFSCQKLQKAVDGARPILESIEEARNQVSTDIKALETYLQSIKLAVTLRYPLGKMFVSADPDEEQHLAAALEACGSASGEIHEEALVWGEMKPGTFRLLYELNRWEGYVDVDAPGGPYFCEHSTHKREAKPLIETKFEVRKRMYDRLSDFVEALSRQIAIRPNPPEPEQSDASDLPS